MNYFNYLFNNIFSWIGCLNLPVVLQAMIFIKMRIMILFTTKKKKKKKKKKKLQKGKPATFLSQIYKYIS